MVIHKIIEIDDTDPAVMELARLAAQYGISDMGEALIQVESLMKEKGNQVVYSVTEESAAEVIATILACAVINYGSWKHEEYYIQIVIGGSGTFSSRIFRRLPPENYKTYADKYLVQAKQLIEKFFPAD